MDSNSPTPSAQNQEIPMSNLITALIANFAENPMGYTDYRKNIEAMLKEHIKPIAVRSQRSISDNSWRSVQKAQFKGRGKQWIWVETQVVEPCLTAWEDEGEDVSVYRSLIEQNGKAWVRYAGPRLHEGAMGAFEVRLSGSKIDHPKHLVYITAASLTEENLNRMEGTPYSLGLEDMPEPEEETEAVEAEADDEAELSALNEGLEAYAADVEIETDDEATAS